MRSHLFRLLLRIAREVIHGDLAPCQRTSIPSGRPLAAWWLEDRRAPPKKGGKLANPRIRQNPHVRKMFRPQFYQRVRDKSLHRGFAPPQPEFRPEFCETNFGRPNFGPEFLGRIFDSVFSSKKRPPEKFTLEKFTSQNALSKIQPRNWTKKFTLHSAGPFG